MLVDTVNKDTGEIEMVEQRVSHEKTKWKKQPWQMKYFMLDNPVYVNKIVLNVQKASKQQTEVQIGQFQILFYPNQKSPKNIKSSKNIVKKNNKSDQMNFIEAAPNKAQQETTRGKQHLKK